MGCFNATCSLSDLTIHSGDKCLLFPLLPTRFNSDKNGVIKIGPSSMHVSNEGAYMFYLPMCLPIQGEYNDYGSIENIVKDENTKAIEERFNMSIEEFVSIITDNRKGMTDSYSDTFQKFAISKKLFEFDKKLDKKFLSELNFEVVNEEEKTYKHPNVEGFLVKLIPIPKGRKDNHYKKPFAYQIIEKSTGKIKKPIDLYYVEKHFVNDFYEMTNYHVNVKPEDQDNAALLMATSGMFVLQEIYDLYTKENIPHTIGSDSYLESSVLEQMGFKLRCVDKTIDRYNQVYEFPGVTDYVINCDGTWSHIVKTSKNKPNTGKQVGWTYRPNDLIKEWKNLTGIDLPVDKSFLNKSKYELAFDEISAQLNGKSKKDSESKDLEKLMEETRQRHLKALSNEEEFNKSFEEMIKGYKEQEKGMKKTYKELASQDNLESNEEEEEVDDILETREKDDYFDLKFKELGKKTKKVYEENAFLVDDNSPIEEKKKLWRTRLEGFVKKDSSEDRLLYLTSPLKHEQLRMKMPVPNYCFKGFEFSSEIYKSRIKSGVIKQHYLDFCHFYFGMSHNHKFFAPAAYGTQDDNSTDKKVLAEKIIEIAKERKKYYQEEEC